MPFFYEDGKRNYAVIPGTIPATAKGDSEAELATFSEFFKQISKLYPALNEEHTAAGKRRR